MTSLEKLEETEFPPIEAFYSELKQSGIDSDTYKKMSDIFKVTLGLEISNYLLGFDWLL